MKITSLKWARQRFAPAASTRSDGGILSPPSLEQAKRLQQLRQLTRAELSAMVTLSALAGYLFAGRGGHMSGLLLSGGVWLLAAGCSALNQWQEQDLDARMERTRQRPLPAGQLEACTVLSLSLIPLVTGLLLLACCGSMPLLLGSLAAVWYNGIYTPLKRRTAFAALPGAVCGALPPLIGWAAAGAPLLDAKIIILAGTLFLWQIPHTWLLLCHYRADLKRSGLPDLFERISTAQLLRINNCWLCALLLCYLQFSLFGLLESRLLNTLFLFGLGGLAALIGQEGRKDTSRIQPKRLFHLLNLSMALLLGCLILDNLLR